MSKYLIGTLVALFVVSLSTPAFALDTQGDSSSPTNRLNEARSRAEQTVNQTRENVNETRDQLKETRGEVKDLFKSQKEQIEQRRSELKQEIESSRAARKTELTDKRLELCQQRQSKINELLAGSAKVGRERLTHIQSVKAKVKDFYTRKNLTSSEYDAALAVVDEKEAAAVAAVEVVETQKFDCAKVDGSKPSGEIKTMHEAKHSALNDYRDSVKQLIQIVKAAAQAKADEGSAS